MYKFDVCQIRAEIRFEMICVLGGGDPGLLEGRYLRWVCSGRVFVA